MMRTNDREWSRYEISAYRQARRAGMPVSQAFTRAMSERIAHRILPPRDVSDGPGGTSYRVDATELAAATSDPRTDALFGTVVDAATGERILSCVVLPTDARATVTVRPDDDASPYDADCYSPDDIAAWRSDAWRYVSVEAYVSLPDGRADYATLGGVEVGEHWGMSWEAAILHTIPSLVSEALAGAERQASPDPRAWPL